MTESVGNFYDIDEASPVLTEGELHSVVTEFGDDVRIKSPGKYSELTNGGDFVVDTLIGNKWVPLRHADFFFMVEEMTEEHPEFMRNKFAPLLVSLAKGTLDYDDIQALEGGPHSRGVNVRTLLRTLTLIMVAEFRRAAQHEPIGGRYLIVRFLMGIIYDCWPAQHAVSYIKEGKPGLRKLRHRYQPEPHLQEVLSGSA